MIGTSAIGRSFDTRWRVRAAALTGGIAITLDLVLCHTGSTELLVRAVPALAALGVLLWLSRGDRKNLGIRLHPKQGWRHWFVLSALAGAGILSICIACLLAFPSQWQTLATDGQWIADSGVWDRFVFACVETPPVEELLYRVILCASLSSAVGSRATILVSGFVFAALHFVYHNPGPDNAVAGFVLAWAYLKSETVAIPVLMHGFGNLVVIGVQLAAAALTH